jgi:hypothetical protein
MKICIIALLLILLPSSLFAEEFLSPSEVALAFYKACGESPVDHAKLDSFRSKSALEYEKTLPPDIQKMRRKAAEKTGGYGTIEKVTVIQERIIEGTAYVDVEIRYTTFDPAKFNAALIKENGQWKLRE